MNRTDPWSWKSRSRCSIADFSEETSEQLEAEGWSLWGGRGLTTLIGDAAHAIRPDDGYGQSLGLEDAVVMGQILASRQRPIEDLSETLRRFEHTRLSRVKRVYDNQYGRNEEHVTPDQQIGPKTPESIEWLEAGV